MYTKLNDVKLKSGEDMEIGVVQAPDEEYVDKLNDLLKHKGDPWMIHVDEALKGEIKDLETRFYIGKLNGYPIANIMTVEYNRAGIFGHVFTRPEHRRKGACDLIMKHQMSDFKNRGGGLLLLGTGYNSPAYWIYHRNGFRSMTEGSGFMRFSTEEDFEAKYFTPGDVKAVDLEWKHWAVMNVLTSVPGVEVMRNLSLNFYGIINFEGGFLHLITRLRKEPQLKVKLLESSSGAVVGCVTLDQDRRWRGKTFVLDIFTHPNFAQYHDKLLNSLELPEGKIQCYVDAGSPKEKIDALEKAGFKKEAIFKNQFEWNNKGYNVCLYFKYI